jgi:ABC-type Co2+ transport system permease subunit
MKNILQVTVLPALILAAGAAQAHVAPHEHTHPSGEGVVALLVGLALTAAVWLALGALRSLWRTLRDARE